MKHIGKRIVKYGSLEFLADEFSFEITANQWETILKTATIEELQTMLQSKVNDEEFEAAQDITEEIKRRNI